MNNHDRFRRLREEFTGKRNIFTVTLALIGAYFIAYPLANLALKEFGTWKTVLLGLLILMISDYIMDAFHKEEKK